MMLKPPKVSKGARAKLRAYFLGNLGRVMDSDELRGVAGGISEWARRIRVTSVRSLQLFIHRHEPPVM